MALREMGRETRLKGDGVNHFVCILLLTLLIGVPSGAQDTDPHELAYCTNHGGHPAYPMKEPHICDAMCERSCGEGHEDNPSGCKTYCRPDHCHCIAECEREPPK